MDEERGIVKYEARDGQSVTLSFDTIKRYLVQGHSEMVTKQELMFFMGTCKSRGLNPFNKDCYLIKYSSKQGAAIITAVDYFRKRARAQRDCHGWQKGIIVERNGEIIYSKGLMLDGDTLLGGWFKAQPEGWTEPFELEVNLKGYIKKKNDGSVTKFWAKDNQPSQIAKVAESQGLRTLWPDEFQQLYTPEEMGEPDSFKDAESIITDKAADLTEQIKEKPKYTATKLDETPVQDLKSDDLDEQKPTPAVVDPPVDTLTGEVLEPDEPKGIIPDGVEPAEWMVACRPSSSVANAKAFIAVFKAQKANIELMDDKVRGQLTRKFEKTKAYLAQIEANKKQIEEEEPPPPEEDPIPPFEQGHEQEDPGGRLAYLKQMKVYRTKDTKRYEKVMKILDFHSMNDPKQADEPIVLGFMREEFGDLEDEPK